MNGADQPRRASAMTGDARGGEGRPRARMRGPEFMAVVVGISQYAREVEEGIYVIPVRALGA